MTVRELHPARGAAGAPARVEHLVRNPLRQRSPVVRVRDPFDRGRRAANFLVAPLDPGQANRAAYRLPTSQRGVFSLGPLELSLTDPFGLVSSARVGAPASTVTVHPRVERVHPPRVDARTDRRSSDGAAALGVHGDEFYGLRDYRTGDDLRRVHWAATARTDELMIRQEESSNRGRVTIALDLRTTAWRPAELEVALSAAASVAVAAGASGLRVRLVHTGGLDTGYTGLRQRSMVLDELAVAACHPDTGETLAAQLRRLGLGREGGTTVAFTSDLTTDDTLAGLARAAGRTSRLIIVVVGRGGATGSDRGSSTRHSGGAIVVRTVAGSFPAAWDRAMAAPREVWANG